MNKLFSSAILICLLLCAGGAAAATAAKPAAATPTVESILNSPELKAGSVAFTVWDLDTGESLYEQNIDKLLAPASNQKLLTAAASILKLGTEFQFRTDFYVSGWDQETGTAKDLYVLGSGDPTFYKEFYGSNLAAADELASQLARYGLKRITGNIILNNAAFSGPEYPPGWDSEDAGYCYGMKVSALSFAGNCLIVDVTGAAKAGEAPTVVADPPLDPAMNPVTVTTSAKAGKVSVAQDAAGGIKISGSIAVNGSAEIEYPVPRPALFFGNVLSGALKRKGVEFKGKLTLKAEKNGPAGNQWELLGSTGSPYLSNILSEMLKNSDNFVAETMLRTLGAQKGGTIAAGTAEAVALLRKYGIATSANLVMVDGSGLSRKNKLTARVLMLLLSKFYNSYLNSGFIAMLAEPGGDGTMKKRLVGTSAQGRLWVKTGALSGVCSLSGYYRRNNGHMAAFSILMNGYKVHSNTIRKIQDDLALVMMDM